MAEVAGIYLAIISSNSTGTAAAENTALTVDISSGPTPSPGIIVIFGRPSDAVCYSHITTTL